MTEHVAQCCALIPARGGSKGIPGKNITPLAGRPLVVHSIEAANQASLVERVVVSTDDPEVGAVARAHGATVVWRPAELSGDTASSESALAHALDQLRDVEGYEPELVVFLQATSPLRRVDDIDRAVQRLLADSADSLFSACPPSGFVWRLLDGAPAPMNYDPVDRPRRQDATEEILIENGSIYVFKPWVLRELNSRLGGKIAVHMMTANDSFEVDEPEDLQLLECLANLRRAGLDTTSS